MPPAVLVAVAIRVEAALVPPDAGALRLVQVGPGAKSAGDLAAAISAGTAAGLVSLGFAGGLDPDLPPASVVVPRRVRDEHGRLFEPSPPWQARVASVLAAGRSCSERDLLTVSTIAASSAEKHRLGRDTGAAAADLESARLAAIAADGGLPFLALRVIFDAAWETLPAGIDRLLTPAGNPRPLRVGAMLLSSPRESWRLLSRYRHAAMALRAAVGQAAPAICSPAGRAIVPAGGADPAGAE